MTIATLFFLIYLFIYLFSKSHGGDNYSKSTKARNLKFGQIINLYMSLCTCNFGGATLRGLGHMPPNLWQRSLLSDFSHTKARNLKFGQMISVFMNLRPSNFGCATSRGLGHMHPKLFTAMFMKWFWSCTCGCCHGRMV